MKYIATIGLEVHVQLKTRTKMFCACPVEFGAEPNTHTCPVCLGLPGALPVMNEEALKMTALTGLMLGCEIAPICKFDRKNYFYPDMPKNYQITQYDHADLLGRRGAAARSGVSEGRAEEHRHGGERSPSRSHSSRGGRGEKFSLRDQHRHRFQPRRHAADGDREQPEIDLAGGSIRVSHLAPADPDLRRRERCRHGEGAAALRLQRLGAAARSQAELGAKIEIKNMNSISGVRRALAYEIERQIGALERGEKLQQETRRWDDDAGETFLMRTKEFAHDYRYFPDPDLVPVKTDVLLAERASVSRNCRGETRAFRRAIRGEPYDAGVLANDLELARYFEAAAKGARKPKNVANWILNDLQSALSNAGKTIDDCPIPPEALDELVNLIDGGKISGKQGKEVFAEMFASGKNAAAIVQGKGDRATERFERH